MNNQVQIIKKQRSFSVDFKGSIVTQYESCIYSVPQIDRLHNISLSLIYWWIYRYSTLNERGTRISAKGLFISGSRKKYGGKKAIDIKHLKDLEFENSRLKWLLADTILDKEILKNVIEKKTGTQRATLII